MATLDIGEIIEDVLREGKRLFDGTLLSTLERLWNNPLFRHTRRSKPLPLNVLRTSLPLSTGLLALLAIIAWITGWRPLGAAMITLSLAGVAIPLIIAPVTAADRVARQLMYTRQDPRTLTDIPSMEVTSGLALNVAWGIRWSVLVGLVLTPALMISLLRLDVLDFSTFSESARVLGDATAAARTNWLLPEGGIPYVRLVIRALTAGLLPWVLLPLMIVLGVCTALATQDVSMSSLIALLAGIVVLVGVLLLWNTLTRTPWLAGIFEAVRLLILIATGGGLVFAAHGLNTVAADWLHNPPPALMLAPNPNPVESSSPAAAPPPANDQNPPT